MRVSLKQMVLVVPSEGEKKIILCSEDVHKKEIIPYLLLILLTVPLGPVPGDDFGGKSGIFQTQILSKIIHRDSLFMSRLCNKFSRVCSFA